MSTTMRPFVLIGNSYIAYTPDHLHQQNASTNCEDVVRCMRLEAFRLSEVDHCVPLMAKCRAER
jgi:hypothetical protein